MKFFLLPTIAAMSCLLAAQAAAAAGTPAQAGESEAMKRLAAERGCTVCHQAQPPVSGSNTIIAPAPSWREIAARYRGRPGAEDQLTRLVIGGSEPGARHWKNRAAFTDMLPNAAETSPEEARSLVRWILSFHG